MSQPQPQQPRPRGKQGNQAQVLQASELLQEAFNTLDSLFRESSGCKVDPLPLPTPAECNASTLLGNAIARNTAATERVHLSKKARKRARHGGSHGEEATESSTVVKGTAEANLTAGQHAAGVRMMKAEQPLELLDGLLFTLGTQLLPSVDAMTRRVTAFITTPSLSSRCVWDVAASLGTVFAAGAASLTGDLLTVLTEESPTLLRSSTSTVFLVNSTLMLNDYRPASDRDVVGVVASKLVSLKDLIISTGPFVDPKLLQRFAMRVAQELIVDALLCGSTTSSGSNNGSQAAAAPTLTQTVPAESVLAHQQLRCPILELLTALLLTVRPLPPVVAVAAIDVMNALGRASGFRDRNEAQAVAQLRATFSAVRHPYAIPFYTPPVEVVEKSIKRVAPVETQQHPTAEQQQQITVQRIALEQPTADSVAPVTAIVPPAAPQAPLPSEPKIPAPLVNAPQHPAMQITRASPVQNDSTTPAHQTAAPADRTHALPKETAASSQVAPQQPDVVRAQPTEQPGAVHAQEAAKPENNAAPAIQPDTIMDDDIPDIDLDD